MPVMRILSVGVKPSFFFFAKRYSMYMSATPMRMTIPIHLRIGFTDGSPGPKSAVYRICIDAECKEKCLRATSKP